MMNIQNTWTSLSVLQHIQIAVFALVIGGTSCFAQQISNEGRSPQVAGQLNPKSPADFGDFDEFVERVLTEWKVPGVAIAVIDNDRILLSKGYGFRDLEQRLPVTSKTLFPIASITKPFTATAAAILLDDRKLEWDDRVRDHLQTFRLYDENAAAQLTIRDCLAHRTGLSMAGLRWYGVNGWPEANITPDFAYRTLRYLEPTASARTTYQYSNSGYLIIGRLIEELSGESWEDFVNRRLFNPLKMDRTNCSVKETQEDADHAKPYDLQDGTAVRRPFFPSEVVAPVGGINSNVEEMTQFLKFCVGQGNLEGKQIVTKSAMKDLLTPEVVMPEFDSFKATTGFQGIGWQLFLIRGEKWARHTGSFPGFTAVAGFCPKRKCAYVVLTNLAYRPTAELMESNIRSRLLGRKPVDEFEMYYQLEQSSNESYEEARQQRRPTQIQNTNPTHPLIDYVGQYTNPAYGDFEISLNGDALQWSHHGFQGPLRHYHYDVFDMEGDRLTNGIVDDDIRRELVTFHAGSSGRFDSLSLPRFPIPKDVVFSRCQADDGAEDSR
ncbi:serine hydrolase [Thalassoglobus sp. JC818]|uniref:serine hydrolase n=1 Tax=Thalassoglobus sp. JC818 TaxID=3232136 RepID=UPI00345927AA